MKEYCSIMRDARHPYENFIFKISYFRGYLHGGGPALMVGLAIPRGQDFTSRLHGKSQPSCQGWLA